MFQLGCAPEVRVLLAVVFLSIWLYFGTWTHHQQSCPGHNWDMWRLWGSNSQPPACKDSHSALTSSNFFGFAQKTMQHTGSNPGSPASPLNHSHRGLILFWLPAREVLPWLPSVSIVKRAERAKYRPCTLEPRVQAPAHHGPAKHS